MEQHVCNVASCNYYKCNLENIHGTLVFVVLFWLAGLWAVGYLHNEGNVVDEFTFRVKFVDLRRSRGQ